MPFGTYDTPKPPKPPTFLQFIKSCPKNIQGKTKFGVDIVWMPGKFNNVTLQTHAFRYVVSENHPLYVEMHEYFKIAVPGSRVDRLDIVIDSIEDAKISVVESTRKGGAWEVMGSNAYKFKEL